MLNILSLFSGIGAFEKALERLNINHKVVAYCEIDKYASKAYSLIHNIPENMNLRDVKNVDILDIEDRVDLITYGFPYQDISLAGKGKGFRDSEGNLTRSGLFFEALRIIDDYKPRFAIAENVKALTMRRHKEDFETVLETLEGIGYNSYYAVLNAKDYGIPQSRDRVFIISIRKDIDKGYNFPNTLPLNLKLKDLLESKVDESYYLSKVMKKYIVADNGKLTKNTDSKGLEYYFIKHSFESEKKGNGFRFEPHVKDNAEITKTITTRAGSRMDDNFILEGIDSDKSLFKFDSTNPILIREATKKGYREAYEGDSVNLDQPNSMTRRGRVGKQISHTLTTTCNQGVIVEYIDDYIKWLRIRKLTPKECFRLMGFDDKDVDILIENKISKTQLYKMAGNSIVVNVLEAIFDSLSKIYDEFKTLD